MKTALSIVLIISSLHAQAQTNWVKGHAVWNYEWFIPALSGSVRIETMNDTIIQGHTCQKLKCDKHTKMITGPNGTFFHSVNTQYQYIYFEQDTVWYLKENEFLVLYDFTAVQGAVRQLEPGMESEECNDSSYLFIDSVYQGLLNGQHALFYQTRDSSANSIQHGGLINSRFGMMSAEFSPSHNFFPVMGWCSPSPNDGMFYRLLCFEDDSLTYNPGNVDCEYYTYLGLEESEGAHIGVFPNPSSGIVKFTSDIPVKRIHVMSIVGEVLKELNRESVFTEIDLSEFPSGTYYLGIENAHGEYVVKSVWLSRE